MKKSMLRKLLMIILCFALSAAFILPTVPLQAEGMEADPFLSELEAIFESLPAKSGSEITARVKLGEGLDLGEEITEALNSLVLNLKFQENHENPEEAKAVYDVNLANEKNPSASLQMKLYNVGKDLVVEIPQLFDKALLISEEALQELSGLVSPTASAFPAVDSKTQQEAMNSLIQGFKEAKARVEQSYGEPVPVAASVRVADMVKDVQAMQREIPAAESKALVSDLLDIMEKNEGLKTLYPSIVMANAAEGDVEDLPEDLSELIAEIRSELVDSPEAKDFSVTQLVYLDEYSAPLGYQLSMHEVAEDGQQGEPIFSLESVKFTGETVSDFRYSLNVDEGVLNFEGSYTGNEEEGKTGEFTLSANEGSEAPRVLVTGTYENFRILKQDGQAPILLGTFELKAKNPEELLESPNYDMDLEPTKFDSSDEDESMEESEQDDEAADLSAGENAGEEMEEPSEFSAEGLEEEAVKELDAMMKVDVTAVIRLSSELTDNGVRYVLTLIPDDKLETHSVELSFDVRPIAEDQISVTNDMPADVYDLSKEEDTEALSENTEDLLGKLTAILDQLGLTPLMESMG